MVEFEIKNGIDYESMINQLMIAIKITTQIYHIDEKKKEQKQLVEALYYIIKNGEYLGITSKHGQRDIISKYTKDDYFNMIIYLLKKYNLSNYLFKKGNKYQINSENIYPFIERACQDVLYDKLNKTYVTIQNDDQVMPNNIKYYSPSDSLRQSIINGTQTSLKNSSYAFNDMTAYSNVGKKRTNQEDSYYIGVHPKNPNFKIMVVADGMGGYANGEIASNIAVKEVMQWFDSLDSSEFYSVDNKKLANALTKKIYEINNKIYRNVDGGGTTLCLAIIKNNSIIMCNIGDSQGFIFEDGVLQYETKPDSFTNIYNVPDDIVRFHKNNNMITNYLGNYNEDEVFPKIIQYKLQQSKTYKVVLCSDGVTDCISNRNIVNIVNGSENSSKALVEYALYNHSYLKDEIEFLNEKDRQKTKFLYNSGQLYDYIDEGIDNTTAVSTIIRK